MKIVFFIATFLFLVSCKKKVPSIFLGTWKIDSSTNGSTKRLSKPYESGILNLKKDGTYTYNLAAADVFNEYSGLFFVSDSINGIKILKLEIGSNYNFYYVVEKLENNMMQVSSRQSYDYGDSTIYFTKRDIFKRKESTK
ncbi:MAG: hypothetical protein ABIP79_06970 [Chitinophagaceae bacterium]